MSNLNPAILRFSHPLAFKAYLQSIGAPVDGYFRRRGLPFLCSDPSAFVPMLKAWEFYKDAARRESRDLGWLVGRFVGDNRLSAPLLKKLETAPTLYQALHRLTWLINSEVSHIKMGIFERQSDVLFYSHFANMSDAPGYLVSQGYQLAVVIDLIRHFAGDDWAPSELGTQGSELSSAVQEQYPNTRLRVRQPFGFISISRHMLHRKLRNPHDVDEKEDHMIWAEGMNYAQTLELLVEPYLSKGYPNMKLAALLMDESTRTVARRLAECGTSYQNLLDSLRFRRASDLLKNTDMPVNEVAWSVGFDDQANFGRMFRRVAGIGPSQFRRII